LAHPLRAPEELVAFDIISRTGDMAELPTGDRPHFHAKM
jgi:hypothetical protein